MNSKFLSIFFIFISSISFSQKNENRIMHISGDDTLVMEFNGMVGDLDSLIEKTLKSFYKIEEDGSNRVEISFDTLITRDLDIRMEKDGASTEKDTVKIKLGNMNIVVIEDKEKNGKSKKNQERKIIIDQEIKIDDKDKKLKEIKLKDSDKSGEAYWAGLSYGMNGMLNSSRNFTTSNDADFLQFDYAKSYEIQFNFAEKRFPIFKEYIGVSTGLGLKWNRFTLENNSIQLNYNDTLLFSSPNSNQYKRSTLRSAYLQAPLLLEFSSNKDQDKAWHFSVGLVGGLRIGSSWRTKTGNDVSNIKGDFNFRPFTASAVAIIGYDDVSLYLNYGLTNLFDENAAPQTKLVSAGVMVNF
jgi:hypothetical protein